VHGLSGQCRVFPAKIGTQLAAETILPGFSHPCQIALFTITSVMSRMPRSHRRLTPVSEGRNASIVANGDGLYTPSVALTFLLTSSCPPSLNVIVGADQDCEGAQSALTSARTRP